MRGTPSALCNVGRLEGKAAYLKWTYTNVFCAGNPLRPRGDGARRQTGKRIRVRER
jgi:hypothetical protein